MTYILIDKDTGEEEQFKWIEMDSYAESVVLRPSQIGSEFDQVFNFTAVISADTLSTPITQDFQVYILNFEFECVQK